MSSAGLKEKLPTVPLISKRKVSLLSRAVTTTSPWKAPGVVVSSWTSRASISPGFPEIWVMLCLTLKPAGTEMETFRWPALSLVSKKL
jgi:hypothetical protein